MKHTEENQFLQVNSLYDACKDMQLYTGKITDFYVSFIALATIRTCNKYKRKKKVRATQIAQETPDGGI